MITIGWEEVRKDLRRQATRTKQASATTFHTEVLSSIPQKKPYQQYKEEPKLPNKFAEGGEGEERERGFGGEQGST